MLREGITAVDNALREDLRVGLIKGAAPGLADILLQLQSNFADVLSRDANAYSIDEGGQ